MVTYFTEKDLTSFGNYLLSPERRKAYEKYGLPETEIPKAMSVINPLDLTSWIDYIQQQRKQAQQDNTQPDTKVENEKQEANEQSAG